MIDSMYVCFHYFPKLSAYIDKNLSSIKYNLLDRSFKFPKWNVRSIDACHFPMSLVHVPKKEWMFSALLLFFEVLKENVGIAPRARHIVQ